MASMVAGMDALALRRAPGLEVESPMGGDWVLRRFVRSVKDPGHMMLRAMSLYLHSTQRQHACMLARQQPRS